jgi:MscS family membrane protein
VHFDTFNAYSLDIKILAHLNTTNRETFLNLQQALLISINQIVEAEGAKFAYPSNTTYLAADSLQPAVVTQVQAINQNA